jgi:hypothetical protein
MLTPRQRWWFLAAVALVAAFLALRVALTVPELKTEAPKGTFYYTGYMKSKAERMKDVPGRGRGD